MLDFNRLIKDIDSYAESVSQSIVIRSYNDGNSNDERRKATKKEREVIKAVVSGALHSIRYKGLNKDGKKPEFDKLVQDAADTAEFIGDQLLTSVNGYDTFYRPVKEYVWAV